MASISEDLPAPVGPVMAKRSREAKSIVARRRKAVKPSSSSFSGFTGDLVVESAKERKSGVAGSATATTAAGVETGEELGGGAAAAFETGRFRLAGADWSDSLDVDGVGQVLADDRGEVGERGVDI